MGEVGILAGPRPWWDAEGSFVGFWGVLRVGEAVCQPSRLLLVRVGKRLRGALLGLLVRGEIHFCFWLAVRPGPEAPGNWLRRSKDSF